MYPSSVDDQSVRVSPSQSGRYEARHDTMSPSFVRKNIEAFVHIGNIAIDGIGAGETLQLRIFLVQPGLDSDPDWRANRVPSQAAISWLDAAGNHATVLMRTETLDRPNDQGPVKRLGVSQCLGWPLHIWSIGEPWESCVPGRPLRCDCWLLAYPRLRAVEPPFHSSREHGNAGYFVGSLLPLAHR